METEDGQLLHAAGEEKEGCAEPSNTLVLLPIYLNHGKGTISFDLDKIAVPAKSGDGASAAASPDKAALSIPEKIVFRGHEMQRMPTELPDNYAIALRTSEGTTDYQSCISFVEPGDQAQPSIASIIGLYQTML